MSLKTGLHVGTAGLTPVLTVTSEGRAPRCIKPETNLTNDEDWDRDAARDSIEHGGGSAGERKAERMKRLRAADWGAWINW